MMHFTDTAIWDNTGFKVTAEPAHHPYQFTAKPQSGVALRIENLNPEVRTTQVMTRWELFRTALWLMRRALFPDVGERSAA